MNNTDLLAENQRLQQRIQELEAKAYIDPLTGCPNRHSYIAETAKVIRRHTDTVYRVGGDEFVVLLQCSPTEAIAVMQRIESAMASVRVCGQLVVLAWGVGRSEEEADAAMYRHKRRCHQGLAH